jgi:hypothetical protein
VVLGLGTVGALESSGSPVAQAGVNLHAPITSRVGASLWTGGVRLPSGDADLLDAWLSVPIRLVDKDVATIRFAPVLSLPLSGLGSGGVATPSGSGSFDPGAQADGVFGGTWVGTALVQTRVPLVDGRDEVRDGVFVRGDLGIGRRLSGWVPSLGLSALHQGPDANGARGYDELAAQATANISLGRAWGLDAGLRVPISDAMYTVALRVGATWVIGKRPSDAP